MMNNALLKLTFILITTFCITSCSDPDSLNILEEGTLEKTSCDFRIFEDDVLITLTQDTEDIQNSKINFILYHFAVVTRDFLNDGEWKTLVSEELNESRNSSLSILDYCDSNPAVSAFYNHNLKNSIAQNLSKSNPFNWSNSDLENHPNNMVHFLSEKLVYLQYQYFPTISINVNEDTFDGIADDYIIAISEQLNAEDEVVGYQNNCTIVLSEEDAINFAGTVLFIGISNDPQQVVSEEINESIIANSKENKFNDHPGNLSDERAAENWNLYLTQYQIKKGYNFERRGRSELAGGMGTLYKAWGTGLKHKFADGMRFNNIKVSRADIKKSKKFNGNWHAENQLWRMSDNSCNNTQNQEDNCDIPSLILIMFEHDWYANYKWYESSCWAPNPPYTTTGFKAKYAHEYYWRDCQQYFFDSPNGWFQVDGQEKYVSNNKGSFRFRRGNE